MELLFTDLEKTEAGAGLGKKSRVQLGLVESEMPIIHSKANVIRISVHQKINYNF